VFICVYLCLSVAFLCDVHLWLASNASYCDNSDA